LKAIQAIQAILFAHTRYDKFVPTQRRAYIIFRTRRINERPA